MFAVQNGGWCAASRLAAKTFNKYGKSSACKSDGEGGPWANQVYYIKGKQTLKLAPTTRKIELGIHLNKDYNKGKKSAERKRSKRR